MLKKCFTGILFLGLCLGNVHAGEEHEINVEIKINCPMSEELQNFFNSTPTKQSANYEEWRSAFIDNFTQLIKLVESNKINAGTWSVNTSYTTTE